jgi:hypothetical protein
MDEKPFYSNFMVIFGVISAVAIISLVVFVLLMLKPTPGKSYSVVDKSTNPEQEQWEPTGNPCMSDEPFYSCSDQKVCRCISGGEFKYIDTSTRSPKSSSPTGQALCGAYCAQGGWVKHDSSDGMLTWYAYECIQYANSCKTMKTNIE